MIKILLTTLSIIALSYISACLYRLGGAAKKGNNLDFLRNKLTRRIGCVLVQFVSIFFVLKIPAPFWVHFLSIGITYGFLTTYWDEIFGYDNHYAHGLGIALGCILYVLVGSIAWWIFLLRLTILSLFMGLWSAYHTNDKMEEYGRGASIQLSLLIFNT